MRRLAEAALESIRRWKSDHPTEPHPPVKVILNTGDQISLIGLAIAPSSDAEVVTLLAPGSELPMFVLRDSDILRIEIEIGPSEPFSPFHSGDEPSKR